MASDLVPGCSLHVELVLHRRERGSCLLPRRAGMKALAWRLGHSGAQWPVRCAGLGRWTGEGTATGNGAPAPRPLVGVLGRDTARSSCGSTEGGRCLPQAAGADRVRGVWMPERPRWPRAVEPLFAKAQAVCPAVAASPGASWAVGRSCWRSGQEPRRHAAATGHGGGS